MCRLMRVRNKLSRAAAARGTYRLPRAGVGVRCSVWVIMRRIQGTYRRLTFRCPRRSRTEPPRRLNREPGVEADAAMVGCG